MTLSGHMMYNPTKGEVLASGWLKEKNVKWLSVCERCKRDEIEVRHSMACFLLCLGHRGVSVAPFGADKGDANLLQDAIPCGGVRLQHHPNLPKWSNWIHALQQRSCKCTSLNSCQSQQCCHIGRSQHCDWFSIAINETLLPFRKQISRNQQRHCQKKKWKLWTLNITTRKFTEPRSSCLNLPKRYF